MAEFDDRFDQAKRIPVPDLEPRIDRQASIGGGPATDGDPASPARSRVLAGVVALVVFVAAGAFAWQAFRPGEQAPADGSSVAADVLRVRCDADSIEVLTPVVAARSDGLHVAPHVTGLREAEVAIMSATDPWTSYWSGSDGVDGEFVRGVPLGQATVHCESGPNQGDGPERLFATFEVADPEGVVADYRLACTNVSEAEADVEHEFRFPPVDPATESEEMEAFWHLSWIRDNLQGLALSDVVEPAGYPDPEVVGLPVSRLVRDGDVIGAFSVAMVGSPEDIADEDRIESVDPNDPGAGHLIPMTYVIRARLCADAGVTLRGAHAPTWSSDVGESIFEGASVAGATSSEPSGPWEGVELARATLKEAILAAHEEGTSLTDDEVHDLMFAIWEARKHACELDPSNERCE